MPKLPSRNFGMQSRLAERRGRRFSVAPYLFVLPFVVGFAVFGLYAIVMSLIYSFTDWRGVGPMKFVWLQNYVSLFSDRSLRRAFLNTLILWVLTVPILVFGSLIAAWFVESRIMRPLRAFFRTSLFLPVLPSLTVVTIIFLLMMDPKYGLIGQLFHAFGLEGPNILIDGSAALPLIALITIWKSFGYMVVIQLAGIQAFPSQVREAAQMDGVNHCRFFISILVPLSKPILAFVGILCTIGVFNAFEESYILYGSTGGPNQAGLLMGTFLYREGIEDFNIGYASAIAYVLALVMILFTYVQLRWVRAD